MRLSLVPPIRWIRATPASNAIRVKAPAGDRAYREAVVRLLLREAPLATIEELVTSYLVGLAPDDLAETRDGIERAVLDLAAIGVLNLEGRSVYASRAAREVGQLLEGSR